MNVTERIDEGLAVSASISTEYTINDLVKISGNETVTVAGAGDSPIGFIRFVSNDKTKVTVETFYRIEMTVKFSEAVAAGDFVKTAAPDVDGNQQFAKFVKGTDADYLRVGICYVGGSAGATGKILL